MMSRNQAQILSDWQLLFLYQQKILRLKEKGCENNKEEWRDPYEHSSFLSGEIKGVGVYI